MTITLMEWLINIQEKDDEMIVVTFLLFNNEIVSSYDAVCCSPSLKITLIFLELLVFTKIPLQNLMPFRVKFETRKLIYYRWNNLPNRVNKLRAEFCLSVV